MDSALLQTALHDVHVQRGGRMVDFAGWSMPVQYDSILAEHQATRDNAGLFDVSHMGRLIFDDDAAGGDWLERLLTRSVSALAAGRVRYSLVANARGEVLDDVLVSHVGESDDQGAHWMLVVNASNREAILSHLQQHSAPAECAWRDVTSTTAMIAVQGPRAMECVDPLLPFELADLKYYRCQRSTLLGRDCWVSRTGYTGEDGCELIVPNEVAAQLWETLEGQPAAPRPVGLGARDTLRLEAGMPLYGHELSREITPFEAGLGRAVDLEDRDFVGRDALAAQAVEPPANVRVGLKLDGKRIAREETPVLADGKNVGRVTSGSFAPTLGQPIAMAMVRRGCDEAGTRLQLDIRGRMADATVCPLPFYQRTG